MGFPFHLTQLPNVTKENKNTKNTLFVIYSQENENQTLSIRKISKKTFSYSNHVHSWIFLLQFDQICLHSKFSLQYLKRCAPHPTFLPWSPTNNLYHMVVLIFVLLTNKNIIYYFSSYLI